MFDKRFIPILVMCAGITVQETGCLTRPDAKRTTAEDLSMLTVRETVGLAFYAGTPSCVMRRGNPEARDTLFSILSTPDLSEFHAQAAISLGYVCESSNINRIEAEIVRRASAPAPSTAEGIRNKRVVEALCYTLGIMGVRDIENAAQKLRTMTSETYWTDIGAVYFLPGTSPVLTDADIFRKHAVEAYAMIGCPDTGAVVESVWANTEGDRKRSLDLSLRSTVMNAGKGKESYYRICDHDDESHDKWIAILHNCWNGDLRHPQPTSMSRGVLHES